MLQHLNKTYKANVPLVLMNSFNTDEDTQKVIRKYKGLQVELYTFNQSCFPRINRESLLPIANNCKIEDDMDAWVGYTSLNIFIHKSVTMSNTSLVGSSNYKQLMLLVSLSNVLFSTVPIEFFTVTPIDFEVYYDMLKNLDSSANITK